MSQIRVSPERLHEAYGQLNTVGQDFQQDLMQLHSSVLHNLSGWTGTASGAFQSMWLHDWQPAAHDLSEGIEEIGVRVESAALSYEMTDRTAVRMNRGGR